MIRRLCIDKLYFLTATITLFLLVGCGGSEDVVIDNGNSSDNNPNLIQIQAQNVQIGALLNQENHIEVQAQAEGKHSLEIKKITLLNNNDDCVVKSIDGLSYTLQSNHIGECYYQYQVAPVSSAYNATDDSMTTATSRVAISTTLESPSLPPVGAITFVGDVEVFDLELLLGADYPQGYQLEQDIQVLGDNSTVSAVPDTQANSIEFSATIAGVYRIYFSLTDGVNIKLGSLDVAVSENGNHPPIAQDYNYTDETADYMAEIPKDTVVHIDLKTKVSDPDSNDVVALTQVFSQNNIISNIDDDNLTFDFQSTTAGPNQVSYAVTDGRGGFDFGVVTIDVQTDATDLQAWSSVDILDTVPMSFSAPLSQSTADEMRLDYTQAATEDGTKGPVNAHVVLMTLQQAQNYCVNHGMRLPTNGELLSLFNSASPDNFYTRNNWPTSYPYWTSRHYSAVNSYVVNLYSGANPSMEDTSLNYVTCLKVTDEVGNFAIDFSSTRNVSDPLVQNVTATAFMPQSNTTAPYSTIRIELQEGKGTLDNGSTSAIYTADGNGMIHFDYIAEPNTSETLLASLSTTPINQLSLLDAWNYEPGYRVDILDTTTWLQSKIGGATDLTNYAITQNKMPLVVANSSPDDVILNSYTKQLTSIVSSVNLQLYHKGSDGGYRVFIHQPTDNIIENWSVENGFPINTHAYGLAIDYDSVNGGSYTPIEDGQITAESIIGSNLGNKSIYAWFNLDGQAGTLNFYVSGQNVRPEIPQIQIPVTQIDMEKPIYLGFSGVGGSDVANVNEILTLQLVSY